MTEHDTELHAEARPSLLTWRKSTRSANAENQCVEVARVQGYVLVRDSKESTGLCLTFSLAEWRRFVAALGDLPGECIDYELPTQRRHSDELLRQAVAQNWPESGQTVI